MEYYEEVISGETFAPVDNLRQIVKHTQSCWGKEEREGLLTGTFTERASLPWGSVKMINFEGFFLVVIWKLFVKVKQSDLGYCIRTKQLT